jgi:hypothetical protein
VPCFVAAVRDVAAVSLVIRLVTHQAESEAAARDRSEKESGHRKTLENQFFTKIVTRVSWT